MQYKERLLTSRITRHIIKYSLIYFGIVFSFGFVFGAIRVLFIVPHLGDEQAELLEMPFMVSVCIASSYYVVTLARHQLTSLQMLLVGVFALTYLLLIEFSLVLWLRDLSISDYMETKYSVSGLAYLASLGLYTLLPYIIFRSRNE